MRLVAVFNKTMEAAINAQTTHSPSNSPSPSDLLVAAQDTAAEVYAGDLGPSNTQQIEAILKLSPKTRTLMDIKALIDFTCQIEFFKELIEENSPEAHLKCCQHMLYECIPKKSIVFDFGDKASKFYVILKGSVQVLVPGKYGFDPVKVLEQGQSFGELALAKQQTRAARIICREECHFATLDMLDFKAILGQLTEQTLSSRVAFLQKLPVFSFWTKKSLEKLSYFFKELKFTRRQTVFRQGDQGNDLYFIKEGEFQLSKTITTDCEQKLLKSRARFAKLNVQIALLGVGEFFGDDDVISSRARSTTCTCQSSVGVLLVIGKDNFIQRLSSRNITDYLKTRNDAKDSTRAKRIENFASLVTKGHLPKVTPAKPSTPGFRSSVSTQQQSRRVSPSRSNCVANETRELEGWGVTQINFDKSSQEKASLPIGSLRDLPITLLALTKRLHNSRGRTAHNRPGSKTHQRFSSLCSSQGPRGQAHPLSAASTKPQSVSLAIQSAAGHSVYLQEDSDEEGMHVEKRRPEERLLSTRHSMFRVSKQRPQMKSVCS
jgi:CRP-like cAMP-binding protein